MLSGRVLITGGTGSLGTHILETAERDRWDAEFVIYSRNEAKQAALRDRFACAQTVLGDVRDRDDLIRAMRGADVVVHAAALKRVPEAERQTKAVIDTNVLGSLNVAMAALDARVGAVIGVSTDKATAPVSAYGQSKALMERLWQSLAMEVRGTRFHLVRYGNVLASTGSVIPLWRKQAQEGGPITVTFPDMTRFWLTLDDAVGLIVRCLDIEPGEVLIPRAPASSMSALAEAVAPGVEQVTIGSRGGERMHERLLSEEEAPYARTVRKGFALRSMAKRPGGDVTYPYASSSADQLGPEALRATIEALDLGDEVRLL